MTTERIREIQNECGLPQSISIQQALLKVWNETEQDIKAIQMQAVVKVNFAEIKEMRKDAQTCIELLKWYDSTNPKHKDNAIDAIMLLARHIEVLTNE